MLALVSSPVFRYAALALALVAGLSWLRSDAAHDARVEAQAECAANNLAALQAERERQEKVRKDVLAAAEKRAAAAEREAENLREKADALVKDLAGSENSCRLSDDVVQRLRGIQ